MEQAKGDIAELEQRKRVERDGVGGIETSGLHMVDGTDSTAELDGYWEGFQFVQVCEGFADELTGFEGHL